MYVEIIFVKMFKLWWNDFFENNNVFYGVENIFCLLIIGIIII